MSSLSGERKVRQTREASLKSSQMRKTMVYVENDDECLDVVRNKLGNLPQ